MTGPEHYLEAERLLAFADSPAGQVVEGQAAVVVVQAQVHATLALAAATWDTPATVRVGSWAGVLA